jgi:hypothetical protein
MIATPPVLPVLVLPVLVWQFLADSLIGFVIRTQRPYLYSFTVVLRLRSWLYDEC